MPSKYEYYIYIDITYIRYIYIYIYKCILIMASSRGFGYQVDIRRVPLDPNPRSATIGDFPGGRGLTFPPLTFRSLIQRREAKQQRQD